MVRGTISSDERPSESEGQMSFLDAAPGSRRPLYVLDHHLAVGAGASLSPPHRSHLYASLNHLPSRRPNTCSPRSGPRSIS